MGSALCARLEKLEDICIVAREDMAYKNTFLAQKNTQKSEENSVKMQANCNEYFRLSDVKQHADIIVNFAHHSLAFEVAKYAKDRHTALCEFCTGHTKKERECIEDLSKYVPVFFASNTALGIAHIAEISKRLAGVFPTAQVEIVETHHAKKADAPSGTALMLANEITSVKGGNIVFERQGKRGDDREIGIHSIRLGDVFGEHSVYIDTKDERIILTHIALSRDLYCDGAERAIRFISTKDKGIYGMQDLLDEYKVELHTT